MTAPFSVSPAKPQILKKVCGFSFCRKTERRRQPTRHPRYKYLSDADKKNTFDVDRYLSSMRRKKKRVVSEAETFELYDIDLSDEDLAAE